MLSVREHATNTMHAVSTLPAFTFAVVKFGSAVNVPVLGNFARWWSVPQGCVLCSVSVNCKESVLNVFDFYHLLLKNRKVLVSSRY